ncbi:hypothetical protein [Chromobacterium sp. IIBBL 290-4]|uniref:hypothetical protein n=1 Tax=Chromobacterium sp. IIBBL 290-4 TaxID=2953890 RepID=UPI0020B735C6|nr:hypothetical protein [Chromobacterium sp. IIBBL 290-4]UTH76254.1 hypothetical protein NKT35_09190 [Chromobacterium sp. IIBBL 290-4]
MFRLFKYLRNTVTLQLNPSDVATLPISENFAPKLILKLSQDRLALLLIALPLTVTGLYFLTFSKERYVSESKIIIKRSDDSKGVNLDLGSLLNGGPSTLREDAVLLQQYIYSPDMLVKLDKTLKLKQEFGSAAGLDFLYRLPSNASKEKFLDYYRARVEVQFDEKNSLLQIRTQGFDPAYARKLNQAILAESERFINELSHKISREDVAFAQKEVDSSYAQLNQAKESLLSYQNKNGLIDPHAEAQVTSQLVAELESKQAQLEAELRNLQSYLQTDSPQVVSAQNALSAIQTQIIKEKTKLASPDDDKLNRKAAQFQEIKSQVEFRADLYKLALTALEKSKVSAAHKLKNLAVISSPQLPEEAEYPRKLYVLASLLFICSLLYGTVRLTISIIEDHKI